MWEEGNWRKCGGSGVSGNVAGFALEEINNLQEQKRNVIGE